MEDWRNLMFNQMIKPLFFALCLISFLPAQAGELDDVYVGEMEEHNRISRTVVDLVFSDNFAELDHLAARYRTLQTRTSSGLWKLSIVYGGLERMLVGQNQAAWFWPEMRAKSDAYSAQFPRSPTAAIFRAIVLRKYGWHIRGGGYAGSVSPEAWPVFYQSLNAANKVLEDAKTFAAIDPEWYTQRSGILAELGAEPAEFEENVVEGLTAFPSYLELYFESVRYYTPVWHGSAAEIDAFANYAVSLTEDSLGLSMYARIYWYAANTQYGNINLFEGSNVDWPKMRQGMMDVVADYPDQWNIQTFAYFSCIKGDYKTTDHFYNLIDTEAIPEVWRPASLFANCRAIAEAYR
ncbi:MAG: hypothetical protein GQ535_00495 [Rhodobacteraceae bacterium]|nr:hypothetical protein [Paracoccaceae bacterium]